MRFVYPDGATPVDADEAADLIPAHISLQKELNEWEELNIGSAAAWAVKSSKAKLISDEYIRKLHKKMFDQTWQWAGKYRNTDKNIGGPWYRVREDVCTLCEDVKLWIAKEVYPRDEIAVRFHHRLVLVHPFPNGNGRHARLMADLLIVRLRNPCFTWGSSSNTDSGIARRNYIDSLRKADNGVIEPLLSFARS